MNRDEAIERAKQLFDSGAKVIYVATEGEKIFVESQPPENVRVVVTARSVREIEHFIEGIKRRSST